MAKNIALVVLALAAPLILVSFLSESEGALWLFSFSFKAQCLELAVARVIPRPGCRGRNGDLVQAREAVSRKLDGAFAAHRFKARDQIG